MDAPARVTFASLCRALKAQSPALQQKEISELQVSQQRVVWLMIRFLRFEELLPVYLFIYLFIYLIYLLNLFYSFIHSLSCCLFIYFILFYLFILFI
jgi:hypothetical protein